MSKIIIGVLVTTLTVFLVIVGGGWPTRSQPDADGEEVVSCVLALVTIGRSNLSAASSGSEKPAFRVQDSIPECQPLSVSAYEVAREAALGRLAS